MIASIQQVRCKTVVLLIEIKLISAKLGEKKAQASLRVLGAGRRRRNEVSRGSRTREPSIREVASRDLGTRSGNATFIFSKCDPSLSLCRLRFRLNIWVQKGNAIRQHRCALGVLGRSTLQKRNSERDADEEAAFKEFQRKVRRTHCGCFNSASAYPSFCLPLNLFTSPILKSPFSHTLMASIFYRPSSSGVITRLLHLANIEGQDTALLSSEEFKMPLASVKAAKSFGCKRAAVRILHSTLLRSIFYISEVNARTSFNKLRILEYINIFSMPCLVNNVRLKLNFISFPWSSGMDEQPGMRLRVNN